jgi:DNA-binding GntR family transcriptional regulator
VEQSYEMAAPAPIHAVTTVAALEQALEDRILDGDLPPGTHLREAELTRDYDVARHSLRAACDGLARRALLTKRVNRGFFVPELTRDDAEEIFDLRRALELPVVRELAAARTVPERTQRALATFEQLPTTARWRDIVRTDVEFHRGLVQAAGNSRLARAHADLLSEITLCIVQTGSTYDDPAEVAREHRDLAKAIRSGKPDRAERELDAHFAEGLRRLPFPNADAEAGDDAEDNGR